MAVFLSRYFDFDNYFGNILGESGLLPVILLFFLILTITTLLESGYTFKVIEKSLRGFEKSPKLNNFMYMFKHEINEIIILVIYSLVPIIIFLTVLDAISTQINFELPSLSENLIVMFIILLLILFFISDMIFTVAIPHMAFKGCSFKEAFKLFEIFRKIKEISLKRLFIGYLIVALSLIAVG